MRAQHIRTSSISSQSDERFSSKGIATRPLLLLVLCLGALTLLPYGLLILLNPALRAVEQSIRDPGRVLLVTAHPDDETVFFAPTITALHKSGHQVFLICLTTGNARGIGHVRVKELEGAVAALQIGQDQLRIENDDRRLPDSKVVDWDMPYAINLIRDAVQRWQIDTLITFDRGGVTGHKNHMSCWQAVSTLVEDCRGVRCPAAWSLLSSGKWKRYSFLVDTPSTSEGRGSDKSASYANRAVLKTFWAMHHHKTQWRWWSHVLFTRYTYFNTLRTIQSPRPSRRLLSF